MSARASSLVGGTTPVASRLVGAGVLVLALAAVLAYAGRQATLTPPPEEVPTVAGAVLDVRFQEDPDGTIRVLMAGDGSVLRTLAPGEGGFMRGVLRPLRRERMRRNVPEASPYRLARWADGRLTLSDPGADLVLELAAYGETSVAAFAALFEGRTASGPGAH
jgi:putative photosynthetic complex assembly protein